MAAHLGAAPEQGDSGSCSAFSISLPSSRLHRSLCAGTGSRAVTYTEKKGVSSDNFLLWLGLLQNALSQGYQSISLSVVYMRMG